jgi:hypothetical protein
LPLGFEKNSSLPDQEQAMSLTEDGAPTSRKPRYGWRDREHWVATQLNSASWSAIFAGAICGLAIYLVLGLFGFAAGIGAIDPAEEANPVSGVPSSLGFSGCSWPLSRSLRLVGSAVGSRAFNRGWLTRCTA